MFPVAVLNHTYPSPWFCLGLFRHCPRQSRTSSSHFLGRLLVPAYARAFCILSALFKSFVSCVRNFVG
jgi:hypothetical protein